MKLPLTKENMSWTYKPVFQVLQNIKIYHILLLLSPCSYNFDDPQLTNWFWIRKEIDSVIGNGLPRDFIHSLRYLPPLAKEKHLQKITNESLQFVYDEFKGHRESFDAGSLHILVIWNQVCVFVCCFVLFWFLFFDFCFLIFFSSVIYYFHRHGQTSKCYWLNSDIMFHNQLYRNLKLVSGLIFTDNIRDLFDSLIAAQKEAVTEGGSTAEFLTDTRIVQTVADMFLGMFNEKHLYQSFFFQSLGTKLLYVWLF